MGRNLGKLPSDPLARLMELYSVDDLIGLSSAMNLPASTVRNWHARGAVPVSYLQSAAKERGSTVDWLLSGIRPKLISLADSPLPVKKKPAPDSLSGRLSHALAAAKAHAGDASTSPEPERKFNLGLEAQEERTGYRDSPKAVPIYTGIHASAGNGSGVQPHEPPEVHVSFSPSYMRRHFGRSGEGFAMIYVKGDSMQPGLVDGDEIVIDTRHRRVDRDGIYVITLRGDLKVKRIQQRLDGSLVVKSDNPAYEAELVTAAQAEEFTVEGRLVWPRLR